MVEEADLSPLPLTGDTAVSTADNVRFLSSWRDWPIHVGSTLMDVGR
jgi:hypothetical protein